MSDLLSIEGETDPIDPSLLVESLRDKIKTRVDLNRVEFANVFEATKKYLGRRPTEKSAPFNVTWMIQVHDDMYCDVWQWAGRVRLANINIGVNHTKVWSELQLLEGDFAYWREHGTYSVLEQAARLHHRCAWIHPFPNGNGRWSRLLADIYLRLCGEPVIDWPDLQMVSPIRDRYLAALKEADQLKFERLMELHREYQGSE